MPNFIPSIRTLLELQASEEPIWSYFDSHHGHIMNKMNAAHRTSERVLDGKFTDPTTCNILIHSQTSYTNTRPHEHLIAPFGWSWKRLSTISPTKTRMSSSVSFYFQLYSKFNCEADVHISQRQRRVGMEFIARNDQKHLRRDDIQFTQFLEDF